MRLKIIVIAVIILVGLGFLKLNTKIYYFNQDIISLENQIANREMVIISLLNRDEFLKYHLSQSNMRISALEQQKKIKVIHKMENISDIISKVKKGKG